MSWSVKCPECGADANGAYDSSGEWGRCHNMSAHGSYEYHFKMADCSESDRVRNAAARSSYSAGVSRMREGKR